MIGGILATLSGLARLLSLAFIADIAAMFSWDHGMPMMWGGWFMGFGLYGGLIGFIGGLLAIILWTSYRTPYRSDVNLVSVVIGAVLLFTGNTFSGILILVGGILQYL